MRRRDFISGMVGSAAAWPLSASAQQPKFFHLGYLEAGARSDRTVQLLRRQFLLGLRDLGYVEGRNFKLEDRYGEGRIDRLRALAAELIALPVDVIAANGEAPISAAKQATNELPIVMLIAADPVGSGFIDGLARPGGNVTGMSSLTSDLAGKRVELLKEVVPHAVRVVVLWNPSNRSKVVEWKDTQTGGQTLGLILRSVEVRTSTDLEPALVVALKEKPDALIVFAESLTIASREKIGSFALAHRLPLVSALREFAEVGGLATYGVSRPDMWRRSAAYIDKIMRGAKPADLPVEQPTRFELVINLKVAKKIGLDIAPTMLTRADEVIE
jgi:putative ABC transport system substrate-binding protein